MDRPVKLSEMIGMLFAFVAALLTAGYNYGTKTATMQTEITATTIRVDKIEQRQAEDRQDMNRKVDAILSTVIDMRLLLGEKQDRKK